MLSGVIPALHWVMTEVTLQPLLLHLLVWVSAPHFLDSVIVAVLSPRVFRIKLIHQVLLILSNN